MRSSIRSNLLWREINTLAERVIEHDRMVNTLDVEIDEESIRLYCAQATKGRRPEVHNHGNEDNH